MLTFVIIYLSKIKNEATLQVAFIKKNYNFVSPAPRQTYVLPWLQTTNKPLVQSDPAVLRHSLPFVSSTVCESTRKGGRSTGITRKGRIRIHKGFCL